jgi:hypothetical protein
MKAGKAMKDQKLVIAVRANGRLCRLGALVVAFGHWIIDRGIKIEK